ncbi:ABC transporter permease [Roseivirga pacifica]
MKHKQQITPPRWADWLLELYCKEEFIEEIQGDAHELFERRSEHSAFKAKARYVWDILRFFRPQNIKTSKRLNSNFINMTRNNFKVAARVLWRQKVNTALNVFSISIGIACFILIGLYVKQETSFDNFHKEKDRIYRAWVKEVYADGRVFFNTHTPLPLGPTLAENIPEVEAIVTIGNNPTLVGRGDGRIADNFQVVTPNFFDYFDFEVLEGNKDKPLPNRSSVVISESYAKKYFGDKSPINKALPLQIDNETRDYIVSAVLEDTPLNSGIRYNILISDENNDLLYSPRMFNAWFSIIVETYAVLKEGVSPEHLSPKTKSMIKAQLGGMDPFDGAPVEDHYLVGFQPLQSIHLDPEVPVANYPVGNPQYVYILGAIGFLVLVIACINYATLSIGQSIKRAKEVGVRKVVGAQSGNLIWQYLSESLLIAILATFIGVLFTLWALPVFNQLAQTNLAFELNLETFTQLAGLTMAIGLLSGIYPSLILARFKLIKILKGSNLSAGKQLARKGMVTFQFLLTIFLISTTLIMKKQLNYLQSSELGYNYDAMVSVPLYSQPNSRGIGQMVSSAMENGKMLKSELSKHPNISDFGMGSHVFGTPGWWQLGFEATTGNYLQFDLLMVDPYYLDAFKIEMVEGVGFDPALDIHKTQGVILNQAAVEYFGFDNPIGKKLPGNDFGDHQIIGVAKDFNYESLRESVQPLVIVQNPIPILDGIMDTNSGDSVIPKLVFRYSGNSLAEVGTVLEKAWGGLFPGEELNFHFVEQNLQNQYENEARVNKIVTIATVLSILIASFGLLGLTILMVNTKVKEIGIRKVLGATPKTILGILLSQFTWQLVIAMLLSIPVTWYLMSQWLSDFAYRTAIGVNPFLLSAGLTMALVLIVIGFHAVRASKINPVKALRVE